MKKCVLISFYLVSFLTSYARVDTLKKQEPKFTWESNADGEHYDYYEQTLFHGESDFYSNQNKDYYILTSEDTMLIITSDSCFFNTNNLFPGFANESEMAKYYIERGDYSIYLDMECSHFGGYPRYRPLSSFIESLNFSLSNDGNDLTHFVIKDTTFSIGILKVGMNIQQVWEVITQKKYINNTNLLIFIFFDGSTFLSLGDKHTKIYPQRLSYMVSINCIYAEIRNNKIIEIGSGSWEYINDKDNDNTKSFKKFTESIPYRNWHRGKNLRGANYVLRMAK